MTSHDESEVLRFDRLFEKIREACQVRMFHRCTHDFDRSRTVCRICGMSRFPGQAVAQIARNLRQFCAAISIPADDAAEAFRKFGDALKGREYDR